jgi:hypothetical protein
MTRPLAAVERFFERLFERPAARLFGTRLEPVQLQRRLERAMESERRLSADRTYVPNRYRVLLNPADMEPFRSYQATLESDLATGLHARARSRGYTLVERPRVTLDASSAVAQGDISVEAEVLDPLLLRPAPDGFRRVDGNAVPSHGDAAAGPPPITPGDATPRAGAMTQTAVFQVPRSASPRIAIEVRSADQGRWRYAFDGGTLRVGRASDNQIVLLDDRVSRHHGQLATRQGALVYTDLGSSNGSFVNGTAVTEIALGIGDVVQLGNSRLTIQPAS